jgi:hypothetical protein
MWNDSFAHTIRGPHHNLGLLPRGPNNPAARRGVVHAGHVTTTMVPPTVRLGSRPAALSWRCHEDPVRRHSLRAYSFGWWLMAGADLFWEKSTADWLLVAGLFWEKSTAGSLVDKPSEQAVRAQRIPSTRGREQTRNRGSGSARWVMKVRLRPNH